MYEFFKNKDGRYVEGYLNSKEDFNGIIFLLREPNDKAPEQSEFWFRNVLDDIVKGHLASRYKNRFIEMLIATKFATDSKSAISLIKNAMYCNLHPEYGESKKTEEYDEIKVSRGTTFIDTFSKEHQHNHLTIFTVWDIYDIFLKHLGPVDETSDEGLQYKHNRKRCFHTKKNSCDLTVYEIAHPSRSSKIQHTTPPVILPK